MKTRHPAFFAAFGLVVLLPADTLALDGPGREIVASNIVRLSSDTERSTPALSYTKRFYVPYPGSVRVKWEARTEAGGQAKVKVVGLAGDCDQQTTTSTTYKAQKCDLPVIAGDRIEVTVSGTFEGNPPTIKQAFFRNVRLHWRVQDSNGVGAVEQD